MEYINFEHNETAAELVRAAYDTPPLAFVHSYGCQQNVNDGERIKGVLVDIGYGLCDKPEDADLILFNTCAVREHAEQRVFGNVGALKGLKEKKRGLMIGLCGCMANQKHVVEKLRKSYPYVDLVFGVDGIDTLPQLIAQKLQKHKRVLMEPAQRPVIVENIPIRRESEFRAWLPIMYGCDNFCTYCIVPYVRGREKSRKPGDILAEFRGLVEAGYKEISLPSTEYAVNTYYIIASAEASSNLARFDGVKYGYRAKNYDGLTDMYERTRSEGFGDEVKRRIMLGTFVLSSGFYDAYYKKAKLVQRQIAQEFAAAFQQCDIIITPTYPTPAFRLGEQVDDPLKMYSGDVCTVPVNIAGLPAISVPCGKTASGLPIGMQMIGAKFAEQTLLRAADAYEQLCGGFACIPQTL